VFAKHDTTRDPPFSSLDLISCRNLMIYLNTALQERLLPIFHYALREPGFLVLGVSETTRQYPGFAPTDAKNKIFARTSAAPRLSFSFSEPQLPLPSGQLGLPARKPWGAVDVHREADRLVLAEFAPPGVVVSDDLSIIQFRGKTGPFLEPAPGVASFDLLRMVREDLRLPLRQLIDEARTSRTTTRRKGLRLGYDAEASTLDLEVIPFGAAPTSQQFFVILFKPVAPQNDQHERAASAELEAPSEQMAQESTPPEPTCKQSSSSSAPATKSCESRTRKSSRAMRSCAARTTSCRWPKRSSRLPTKSCGPSTTT
jgi:two-component system CheB/CheR fusion protein